MGLDSIELVMEIEKAFEISIPDHEAEKIRTVGDLHNTVWNHLTERHSSRCNSQILFYKLRKNLAAHFEIEKQSFKTDTLLNTVFPQNDRRNRYRDFENTLTLKLPELILTKPWKTFLHTIGLITILGGLLYALFLAELFNYSRWVYLIPVAGILITYILSEFLNPKRIVIEPGSVRGFTEKTLALNINSISKGGRVNRKEVENVINQIIVDKIGVDWDEISPEKSLTDDLGVD
jgi:acyl carrier protein